MATVRLRRHQRHAPSALAQRGDRRLPRTRPSALGGAGGRGCAAHPRCVVAQPVRQPHAWLVATASTDVGRRERVARRRISQAAWRSRGAAEEIARCVETGRLEADAMKAFRRYLYRHLHHILPLPILLVAFFAWLGEPGPLVQFRLNVFDEFLRLKPRSYEARPGRLGDNDEDS